MKKIVIVGMGTIGKSIALALAQNGHNVTVVTRRGEKGFLSLRNYIDKVVQSGKVRKSTSEILTVISWIDDASKIPYDADLLIETVKEDLLEKQLLFKKLDAICPSTMILSSNTSSLSIAEISRSMTRPERMLGVHFFNPAQVIKLVELIPGEKTSKDTVRKASMLLEELGKIPLIVPDQPGFVVNRLLFLTINEAINTLEEGKLAPEEIDMAIQLGLNHPMGPLHLADFLGLDVCLTILENLYGKTRNPQYKPNALLVQKVRSNNLGKKTGKGFFVYSTANESRKVEN
jgi:3-hydroxybutyryl-CoA dehydrogenase